MQLVAENLVIERGGRVIVHDVSFALASGEALILSGANGAGKTTLLRAIAGFLPIASGALRFVGAQPEALIAEQAHAIGHANAVKTNLTVLENVTFWANFLDGNPESGDRVQAALEAFGLSDLADFPAGFLSAGQKRRLGLARLLAAPRPIWLLDEPTVSLDAVSAARLAKVVNAHTADGGIVIAATHLPLGLERARDLPLRGGKPQ